MPAPSTPTAVLPPAAPATLPLEVRIADHTVMTLAVILGAGSIALFAWPSRPVFVPMDLSLGAALAWNALLSLMFFLQHSVLVRRPVRRRLAVVIPERYDGAFYAITSGIALALFVLLAQPAGAPLFVLHGFPRLAVAAVALLAVAGFVWGAVALRGFDPLGLRPIRKHLRDVPGAVPAAVSGAKPLVVRGPYRWVRHPLYSCVIVLLWADPELTLGRLTLAALWTGWIYVGALLEERDLIFEFGDPYRRYREQVPILVPWSVRSPGKSRNDFHQTEQTDQTSATAPRAKR